MRDIRENDLPNLVEEDDPIVFLRRHRREISTRFGTVGELTTYLKQFDSVEKTLARIRERIAEKRRLQVEPQS